MRKKINAILGFLLVLTMVSSMGYVGYRVEDNKLSLRNVFDDINSIHFGVDLRTSVLQQVLSSHKKAIETLSKKLDKERAALKKQGALTKEIAARYEILIEELKGQLLQVNQQIELISKALEKAIDKIAAAEKAERFMYNQSLRASVFIMSEYFDPGSLTKEDENNNQVPNPVRAGSGSGTFIKVDNGATYILTAQHVVADFLYKANKWNKEKGIFEKIEKTISPTITISNYRVDIKKVDKYSAVIVVANKELDLAVLRVDNLMTSNTAPIIKLSELGEIKLHDKVYTTGCPLGATPRISRGYITARIHAIDGYIEADCQIIWGNSGGALFHNGRIIGVVSKGRCGQYQMVESLGLYISPAVILKFLKDNKI